MTKRKRRKTGITEIADGTLIKEYQEPEIFKKKFQGSKSCLSFRKAWGIPPEGFEDPTDRVKFGQDLRGKDYVYAATDLFKKRTEELRKKKIAWAKGKIQHSDLKIAELNFDLTIPSVKYDFDLSMVIKEENKPAYWKNFIESCLLLKSPEPQFIWKPLPQPKLRWSNELQCYEITIENIFADTTAQDFKSPLFTKLLVRCQKKIPGYTKTKPRSKKGFNFGMKALELKESELSDRDIADKIYGTADPNSPDSMVPIDEDRRRKNRVKTARRRLERRIGW